MPEMSSRTLAEELRRDRPDLPVVYMSGYGAGLLGPQRVLDPGVAMMRKPFNEASLLRALHIGRAGSTASSTGPAGATP